MKRNTLICVLLGCLILASFTIVSADEKINMDSGLYEYVGANAPKGLFNIGTYLQGNINAYNGIHTPQEIRRYGDKLNPRVEKIPGIIESSSFSTTIQMKLDLSSFENECVLRMPMLGVRYRVYQDDNLIGSIEDTKSIAKYGQDNYIYENYYMLKNNRPNTYVTIIIDNMGNDILFRDKIYVNNNSNLIQKQFIYTAINFTLVGSLIITALYALILYLSVRYKSYKRGEQLILYILLITVTLAIRALLSIDLINTLLYPVIGRSLTIRIFNVVSDFTFISGILFVTTLYEEDNKIGNNLCLLYYIIALVEAVVFNVNFSIMVNIINLMTFGYLTSIILKNQYKISKNKLLYSGLIISFSFILFDILYYIIVTVSDCFVRTFSFTSISVYLFIIPSCLSLGIEFVDSLEEKNRLLRCNRIMSNKLKNINSNIDYMVMSRTRELENSYFEMRKEVAAYRELSTKDPLTNLSNRRHFLDEIEKRYENGHSKFALIIGDIDDFKSINDKYGHNFGDKILKDVGGVLSNTKDIVARWGGEEFIICMDETNRDIVNNKLKNIMKGLRGLRYYEMGENITITMTYGVYLNSTYEELIKSINYADISLYHGKDTGKDRVIFYSEYKNIQ